MPNELDTTIARSGIYQLLAAALSSPKSDTLSLYAGLLQTHSALQSTKDPLEGARSENLSLTSLAKEHLRLFVGPGHTPCPPYEAVHRRDRPNFEKGLVMGPSTADVRRAYLEAGLNFKNTYTDLPDHIATEMEFMHFLCSEESRLAELGNNGEAARMRAIQREFHKNHIEPWVKDFADCILRSTTSPFYKTTANVLKDFTQSEADYLAEAV
jgi:TorA maturation chaperone TorD